MLNVIANLFKIPDLKKKILLTAALIAVYLACFRDYSSVLAPGERGILMVISQDRQQARVVHRYISALFDMVPMLSGMVESQTKEAIHLNNRVSIEIHTCSFRAVRGYTIIGAVCDEIAFWRDETSANPDEEIVGSIRPGMSTVPGSVLLCISSPYSRRGALWKSFKRHHGQEDSPVLVWQADTRAMNPTVSQEVIDEAYLQDESSASAEYGAQFRKDIEGFVSLEVVESCVVPDRISSLVAGNVTYQGFADPSGGARDSFTLAVAHQSDDGETVVLDCLLERKPPFSPEDVVMEFAETLRIYRVSHIVSDRYAGEWPKEQFMKQGIDCEQSAAPKSDLYRDLLPLLNSGKVELLDNKRLVNQLIGLERRTARSGKDSIDHGPGCYDDLANAVAGVAAAIGFGPQPVRVRRALWG